MECLSIQIAVDPLILKFVPALTSRVAVVSQVGGSQKQYYGGRFLRTEKILYKGFTIPGNSVVCIEANIKYGQSKAPWKRTQHCWMLHGASVCTPCFMLLHVVGSCCRKFETGQTSSYMQTDATTPNYVASVCTGLKQKIGGEFFSYCLSNMTYEDIN